MKIFAANWKLNKSPKETHEFLSQFKNKYKPDSQKKVVIFPSTISLDATASEVSGTDIEFGAQNCYIESKGAFTGENSGQMVKDLGGKWILMGHSERRSLLSESDSFIAKKVAYAQSIKMTPMLCIGESLDDRQGLKTSFVLEMQLRQSLNSIDRALPLTVAYEPIWAIGTGKVATKEQVIEAHDYIHETLIKLGFPDTTPVLYGGSVKPDNINQLIHLPHVDGFLIGGASLEVQSFLEICSAGA